MPIKWVYTPPPRNPVAILAAVAPAVTRHVADQILSESQQLVPVDSGALQASGKVTQDDTRAIVSYDVLSDDDGYPYGIRQHEDLTLHHPNGGQAKFLEIPLRHDPEARFAEAAGIIREALL